MVLDEATEQTGVMPVVKTDISGFAITASILAAMGLTWLVFGGMYRSGTFLDNDDLLRLKQVRDLIAGKAWYDLHEPRFGSPEGLYIHWSRLVDGLLAGLIGLVSVFTPRANAEQIVLLWYPLGLIAPAILAIVAMGKRLGGPLAGTLAAVHVAASFTPGFFQFRPGRIDHHNVQTVLALALFACMMALNGKRASGVRAGLILALMMAIGFETIPFAGLALLIVAGRYLWFGDTIARETSGFLLSVGLATPILLMIQTDPNRWFLSACDSLAFNLTAGMMAGCGVDLLLLHRLRTTTLPIRCVIGLAAALSALGIALYLEPRCINGPFGQFSAAVGQISFELTTELRPIRPSLALADFFTMALAPMVFGAIALGWLARLYPEKRYLCLITAAFIGLAGVLGLMMNRNFPYAALFASPAIAAGFAVFLRQSPLRASLKTSIVMCGLIAATPVFPAILLDRMARHDAPKAEDAATPKASCDQTRHYEVLARLRPGLVLAPPNAGTAIVTQTPHSALSGPYHRLGDYLPGVQAVFEAPPNVTRDYAFEVGAAYVAVCKDETIGNKYTASFVAAALRGERFDWLDPLDTQGPLLIWKVVR